MTSRRRRATAAWSSRRAGPGGSLHSAAAKASPATTPAEPSDLIRELHVDEEWQSLAEGDRLAALGDFESARRKYAHAWSVWRFPDVLLKLADAEHRSSHHVDAARRYRELLELTKPGTEYVRNLGTFASFDVRDLDAIRAHAVSALDSLMTEHLAQLAIEAPADSVVTIDGHRIVVDADPVLVTPGEHAVVVRARDQESRREVSLVAGELRRIAFHGVGHAE